MGIIFGLSLRVTLKVNSSFPKSYLSPNVRSISGFTLFRSRPSTDGALSTRTIQSKTSELLLDQLVNRNPPLDRMLLS